MRLEALELSKDQSSMSPRASVRDVEVIAPRLWCVGGAAVGSDCIAKRRRLTNEFASGLARVVPLVLPLSFNKQSHLYRLA